MIDIQALREVSARVGSNTSYVQGQGGNTSLKSNNVLHVKASGMRLADANQKDIFVQIRIDTCLEALDQCEEFSAEKVLIDKNVKLRPSIEATLHALLPYNAVIHSHPVNTLATAVRADCQAVLTEKLRGLNWSFVPYFKPGVNLATEVSKLEPATVIVLGNHGLVTSGETPSEAEQLLIEVEKRLAPPKPISSIQSAEDLPTLPGYEAVAGEYMVAFANNQGALEVSDAGPLCPDQVVFLGPMVPIYSSSKVQELFDEEKLPDWFVWRDHSVYARIGRSHSMDAMLEALSRVALSVQPGTKIQTLSPSESGELLDWDQEKYRQEISKHLAAAE